MVWCGWVESDYSVSSISISQIHRERNSDREVFTIMINQIGMLQEQGNTCKDLDWGAFRILKTDWLSLPDWLTEKSLTDWQKYNWLTDWKKFDWLTKVRLIDWLTDKMSDCLANWVTDWQKPDWLTDWQKSDWLTNGRSPKK